MFDCSYCQCSTVHTVYLYTRRTNSNVANFQVLTSISTTVIGIPAGFMAFFLSSSCHKTYMMMILGLLNLFFQLTIIYVPLCNRLICEDELEVCENKRP